MIYHKGDIVWIDFPFTDGTGSKISPALVISNQKVNQTGDYLLMQITSRIWNDGLSFTLLDKHYKLSLLEISSHVRIHKIFSLNQALILGRKTALKGDCIN